MEHIKLTLACGHTRNLTLDNTGKSGTRIGRAARIAGAFLRPCLICQVLADEQRREDEREYAEAIRITDRRNRYV